MNKPINLKLYLYQKIILNFQFSIFNFKIYKVNFESLTHRLLRRHLPYKGRQTPLTPLHRGGLGLLAFSLIELSIVLIIIGLLVAGVTGGKSLIESAKQRALINELNGWRQAVYTFYAAQGRLPGDIKNTGVIGYGTTNTYPAGTFQSPYDSKAENVYSAEFIELYLEGISDFKPKVGTTTDNSCSSNYTSTCKNGGAPLSNILKNSPYHYRKIHRAGNYVINADETKPWLMLLTGDKNGSDGLELKTIKMLKQTDEKIDDGKYNSGIIRSECSGVNSSGTAISMSSASYDQAIDAKNQSKTGACRSLYYLLGI